MSARVLYKPIRSVFRSLGMIIVIYGKFSLNTARIFVKDTARLRSILLVPANELIDEARLFASGADALLLSLASGAGRLASRRRARALLEAGRRHREGTALFMRIASTESGEIDADLAALIPAAPDGVFLEDSRGRASVEQLCVKLAVREAEAGLVDGATKIVALAVETPAGAFGLGSYAGCSPRLVGLAFDEAALGAAPGLGGALGERGAGGPPIGPVALARSLLILGAAAAGVAAIDGPQPGAGFAASCRAARADGFGGKIALDAAQVAAINAIFAGRE